MHGKGAYNSHDVNRGQIKKCNTFAHLEWWLVGCIVLSWSCHLISPRHNFSIYQLEVGRKGWTRWCQELVQLRLTRMLKSQQLSGVPTAHSPLVLDSKNSRRVALIGLKRLLTNSGWSLGSPWAISSCLLAWKLSQRVRWGQSFSSFRDHCPLLVQCLVNYCFR